MDKTIVIKCTFCNVPQEIGPLTRDQFTRIQQRKEPIQNIAPELSAEDREMFISKTCPKCWDKIFSGDTEE